MLSLRPLGSSAPRAAAARRPGGLSAALAFEEPGAFGAKSSWELLRALCVFQLCSFPVLVNNCGKKDRYVGHDIRNDLGEEDEVQRQRCKLHARANMSTRRLHDPAQTSETDKCKSDVREPDRSHFSCRFEEFYA
ncbi:hypothetical protein EYF80_064065 [Liparis tanakae]|uniref:Uncharacterized protein n=1 Tax=Liparis tanakae TaxID=230148 RepID=A0A4Z2EBX2_9TELE|nr:hypothetical protein EYF80_064065 [Liparis tanakae]